MKIDKIRVRPFTLSDLNRILEIEHTSFGIDAFSEFMFRDWYQECPDLFIVAEVSEMVVGYMITCILHDKAEIVSIAVDPAHRGKRAGRTLGDFTLNRLHNYGLEKVELEVRTTNVEGIRFWESCGFFHIGTIPNYYHDGTDAVQMRKLL